MRGGGEDWSSWFREYGPAMLLFARQALPDLATAEDAVQEAFVRFWKSRASAEDVPAYLFACVRNCVREIQRGESRRLRRDQATARPELTEALFDCPLERDERRTLVEAGLLQLPCEQRDVLVLKIWGGLSFPQIAAALDIPANTAASRYRYALEKLRELLVEVTTP